MAQESDSDVKMVFNSRTNILKQLAMSGYNINDYESFGYNEVNIMRKNNQLDMLIQHNESDKKVYVKYYTLKTLKQNTIEEFIEELIHTNAVITTNDVLMIVIKDMPNETMQNVVKHIWNSDNILVIVRGLKSLQFNLLEHTYVPPHYILNNEDTIRFKERFNILHNGVIPEISRFDPVSLAIMIKPDEICRIERSSKTAIVSDFYRICVNY